MNKKCNRGGDDIDVGIASIVDDDNDYNVDSSHINNDSSDTSVDYIK